jgi:hypothetical protein
MEFIINQVRREFYADGTTGRLYIPNFNPEKSVYTCEDAVRPNGLKLFGEGAIPDGVYYYELTHSPKFGRVLPLIYTDPISRALEAYGVKWTGVRMHVGGKPIDSHACVLTGYQMVKGAANVYESKQCESDIVKHLEAHAPKGLWIISSLYPS